MHCAWHPGFLEQPSAWDFTSYLVYVTFNDAEGKLSSFNFRLMFNMKDISCEGIWMYIHIHIGTKDADLLLWVSLITRLDNHSSVVPLTIMKLPDSDTRLSKLSLRIEWVLTCKYSGVDIYFGTLQRTEQFTIGFGSGVNHIAQVGNG